ncbi:MAG TPA: hypothetical protein PKN87_06210 [Syntrophomonadaceae bacterium]|nr:hypothetical protein [Syntrophomonadaceae bacterium]HNX28990.1 hypothetical protein [Syntrophomonadaceae bacterium]HPR93746.1 hypothetical protein [Syntrophomonadaceae bacterium]
MNNSSLDILIDVSIKYPELNGIKYKTDEQTIAMKFALQGIPAADDLQGLQGKLYKSYQAYHALCGSDPHIFEITAKKFEGIVFFTLYRDEDTLTKEEIDLYITILKDDYDHYLIKDKIDMITNDTYKQSLKKNLLHRISQSQNCSNFWAFRQGGKVFVLNN